jgi:hypothetical protein
MGSRLCFKHLRTEQGVGIITVLLMASVLTLGVYLFTSSISIRAKSAQGFKQAQGRDLIGIQIESMTKDPLTVLQSLNTQNPALAHCVLTDTQNCGLGAWSEFKLFRTNLILEAQVSNPDPAAPVDLPAPPEGLGLLTGFYSNAGALCSGLTEANRNCPFQVTGRFCATDREAESVKNTLTCTCQEAGQCPTLEDVAKSILFEYRVSKVYRSDVQGDSQVQLKDKVINQVFTPEEILNAAQ